MTFRREEVCWFGSTICSATLPPLDRTLGRWDNVVAAAFVVPQAMRGARSGLSRDLYENEKDAPETNLKSTAISLARRIGIRLLGNPRPKHRRDKFDRLMVQESQAQRTANKQSPASQSCDKSASFSCKFQPRPSDN